MVVLDEEVFDVTIHCWSARAFGEVPVQVDAGKFPSHPVSGDIVVSEQGLEQVVGVAFVRVLDAEVVNDEDKDNPAPLVLPQARCGVALIVAVFVQPLGEEVIGEFARLFKAINALGNFEVDPAMVCEGGEIVFIDEFLRYDG